MSYHYARKPAQQLTPGDDQPETPCTADVAARLEVKYATGEEYPPSPFDVLMEHSSGIDFRIARAQAISMCSQCDIRRSCHTENAEEWWVQALAVEPVRPCQNCGQDMPIRKHAPSRRYCSDACGVAARRKRTAA